MDEVTHEDNALQLSPFWSEPIPYASCIVTRFPWNKTQDTPEFTGLPTDVLYMTQVENLKMEMDELLKSFELMRSALLADNCRVVVEVCEKIISELDLRSVGREGYIVLHDIDQKLTCSSHALIPLKRLSLVPTHRYPMMKMATPFFSKHVMWTRR